MSRSRPSARLWPLFGLVLLVVAPFPWAVLASPAADPPPLPAPEPEEPTTPPPTALVPEPEPLDPVPEAIREPVEFHLDPLYKPTAYDIVAYTNATFYVSDATGAPSFIRVLYHTDVALPPATTTVFVRTAATPAVTWSLATPLTGPVSAVAAPATQVTLMAAPAVQAGAPAPASAAPAAPAVQTPTPAPSSGPAAPAVQAPSGLSMVPGSVAELFTRVPPDLAARPFRLVRLMGRGLSLLGLLFLRHRDGGIDQETRRLIYAYLRDHPGALAGQIADHLGVRRQTVLYHLRVLMHEGYVISQANGRRHYFRRDDPQRVDSRNVLSPGTRSIFEHLPEHPVTAQELSERLGITRRTVQWHLGRLRDYGLVRGLRTRSGTRYMRSGGLS